MRKTVLREREKGSALFIALGVIVVLSFLGVAFMKLSVTETHSVNQQVLAEKAFYIAETGVQRAIKELDNNKDWTGVTNVTYGSGTYTVQVSAPDADKIQTITSTGKVGKLKKKVEVKVKQVKEVPEALFYCQFGRSRLTMHADTFAHFGMKVYGNSWCNNALRFDEGTRHWGDVTANDVRNGDISEGWGPPNGMTSHDSSIIYGDVVGADIDNRSWGYILARSPDTTYDLDTAYGDATTKDAYWQDTLGIYYKIEDSAPVSNSGYIQGTKKQFLTGTPPGDSTYVEIPFPVINSDTLRDLAMAEGHWFGTDEALYTYLRTLPNWDTIGAGSDTIRKMYGKVFFVEEVATVDLENKFNGRNRFDIQACLVATGGINAKKKNYSHIAPDSFPAIVIKDGYMDFKTTSLCSPPCPVYIQGLIYNNYDDGDMDPYNNPGSAGQVHLHHRWDPDSIHVFGAVMADYVHDCVRLTVRYDPKVRWTSWLFDVAGEEGGSIQVVSWRQLKRG